MDILKTNSIEFWVTEQLDEILRWRSMAAMCWLQTRFPAAADSGSGFELGRAGLAHTTSPNHASVACAAANRPVALISSKLPLFAGTVLFQAA